MNAQKRWCFLLVFLLIITLAFASVPQVPTNVKAKAISDTEINVTWNNSTEAKTYSVYRNTESSGTFTLIKSGIKKLFYLDSDLQPETKYFYKISASNSSGESTKSTAANATTFVTPPKLPQDFTAVAATKNRVSLFWTKTFGLKYKIYRSTSLSGEYIEIKSDISDDSYGDSGLSPSTKYYYKISSYNPNEESGLSQAVSITTLAAEPEQVEQEIQNQTIPEQVIPQQVIQTPPPVQQQVQTQQPEPSKNNLAIYLVSALVFVLVILSILVLKRKSKKIDYSTIQVRNYIYDNLRTGHSKEQIINLLKQHGHSQEDIDKALKYL